MWQILAVLENVKYPGICQYNLKKVSETAAGHTYIILINSNIMKIYENVLYIKYQIEELK